MEESFYGQQHFSYIDGVRHAVGQERHERVRPDETTAAFLTRIETLAKERNAGLALEYARGRIVGAFISWSHPPVRAPFLAESTVTDARRPGRRGTRGSGRTAQKAPGDRT